MIASPRSAFRILVAAVLAAVLAPAPANAAIAFVQGNGADTGHDSTISSTFTGAQSAGNLIFVSIAWCDDTTTLVSITDTKGNTYTRAALPVKVTGSATGVVYYAKNIVAAAAGSNTVTVVLSGAVDFPLVMIAEYSGLDTTNPLDAIVGTGGVSNTLDSGNLTTSSANDVLIGTGVDGSTIYSVGSGFTERVNYNGNDIQDRVVAATGSYNATASTYTPATWWIQTLVAFRAAPSDTQAPTVPTGLTAVATSSSQINVSWNAATDNVGVTGYLLDRCTGVSCSTFAQIATPATTTYSNTGLTASTSYSYRVRAKDAAGNISGYSSTSSATTNAAGDTQPPTAPSALTGLRVSTAEIDLSWAASTDNVGVTSYKVERCTGTSCTTYAQVGTSSTTTYIDTGLAGGSAYRYRVRAADAAGNNSAYSSVVTFSATTGDTTAPTAPGTPTLTVASSTQINLSWTAATDNVAVTAYLIESCMGSGCSTFSLLATLTSTTFATTYNNAGLAVSTTYRYRIRARDANGNLSAYSGISTATTSAAPDTQAPTAPSSASATAASSSQINVSWSASTDNVGVTGYLVERCQGVGCSSFAQVATPTGTSFADSGLAVSTTYQYRVRATDAANNLSAYSATVSATTSAAGDTQAPTAPTSLSATASSSTQINLSWTAATDNVGVTGYRVERCTGAGCGAFSQISAPAGTSFSDTGLTASTTYRYQVRATDAAGNLGPYSAIASATTQNAPDTQAPTAPASLTATPSGGNQVALSWPAATDNVGVTNYSIERCTGSGCSNFAQIGSSATLAFTDSSVPAATTYQYRVRATDAAGNWGSYSPTASAYVQDLQAPTAPSGLSAAPGTTQMYLSWNASTDNVGVTGYFIERCLGAGCSTFAQIGSSSSTSFTDSGLIGGATYGYRVRATDAAGNLSAYSGNGSGVMATCD